MKAAKLYTIKNIIYLRGTTVKQDTVPNAFKGVYFVQAMLNNEIVQVKFFKQ